MKKLTLSSVLVLGMTVGLPAQDIPFVFDKNRIDVGTVYIYGYASNMEASQFEPDYLECFYFKTLNDIEIIRVPIEDTIATYLIKYKMNWDYMMLEKLEFLNFMDKSEIPIGSTLSGTFNIDFSNGILRANYINRAREGFENFNWVNKFEHIPTYFYETTSLLPLCFILRFYPFYKEKILVNHNSRSYNVRLEIKYMGKEQVEVPYGKVSCHKFELDFKLGLFMSIIRKTNEAYIWLTSKDERSYMVKYRYPPCEMHIFCWIDIAYVILKT